MDLLVALIIFSDRCIYLEKNYYTVHNIVHQPDRAQMTMAYWFIKGS